MRVWMVYVNPVMGGRYIDSMWASEEAAGNRKLELRSVFVALGCKHDAYVSTGEVADVKLIDTTVGCHAIPEEDKGK